MMKLFLRHFAVRLAVALMICAALAGVMFAIDWRGKVERRLEGWLEAQGLENVHLSLSGIGRERLSFSNVTFGPYDTALSLSNLSVRYDLRDVIDKRALSDLQIEDLAIGLRQTDAGWQFSGLSARRTPAAADAPLTLPIRRADMVAVPFDTIRLARARLTVTGDAIDLAAPLDIAWVKAPLPGIRMESPAPHFTAGAIKGDADTLSITMTLGKDDVWTGDWRLKGLRLTGAPAALPVADLSGTVTLKPDRIVLSGRFVGRDKSTSANFTLSYPFDGKGAVLTMNKARTTLMGGTLSVSSLRYPIGGRGTIRVPVALDQVSVDQLMQMATGKRVTATGTLSGAVPVLYNLATGAVTVDPGGFRGNGPGVMSMPADAIPGAGAQLDLVRDILKNLHYDRLSIEVDQAKGEPVLLMSVEGNNPDIHNGHPVKLNVRLTGDVIDFARQNIMLLTDPTQLLKTQGKE